MKTKTVTNKEASIPAPVVNETPAPKTPTRAEIEAHIANYEGGLAQMQSTIASLEKRLERERHDFLATTGAVQALRALLK